jgi:hypothetical protein
MHSGGKADIIDNERAGLTRSSRYVGGGEHGRECLVLLEKGGLDNYSGRSPLLLQQQAFSCYHVTKILIGLLHLIPVWIKMCSFNARGMLLK